MRHYTEQHRGRRAAISPDNPKSASRQFEAGGDFLPNLCSVPGVFALVLVGELLSLALVLADGGLRGFEWYKLGVVSLLVEWIVLFSAACLCRLRPWFKGQSPVLAGCVSYCIVLAVTLIFTALGQRVQNPDAPVDVWHLASNFLIAAVFAGVALRYFFLQQQLQNQQQAELRARIQALQSRIHPHFLFNSMNSIASLVATQPAVAERMVEDLSGLFRASLSDLALIPLREELDLCHRFVRIEQLRLGDRLHVRWQLPEHLPDTLTIPGLLLQPLIENAIYHGVQPLPQGGEVLVTMLLDQEDCSISVTNPIAGNSASLGNGLALDNIRQRLAAHYGERGQLRIQPEADIFTVTLRFPAQV